MMMHATLVAFLFCYSISVSAGNEEESLHIAPVFKDIIEKVTVGESESLEVLCSATGSKPITYNWIDPDENRISSDTSENIYTVLDDDGSWLFISKVSIRHQGAYTCTASNEYGLSSKFFNVVVKDNSKNETDTNGSASIVRVVAEIKNNSISFKIYTQGNVDTIFGQYSEIRLPMSKSKVEWKFGGLGPYEVKNLTASGKYSFQFRLSESEEWSKVYTYVMLPDIPHVIFGGLNDGVLKLEWFRKWDDIARDTIDKYELSYNRVSQYQGNYWQKDNCTVTIEIPKCGPSSYTITPLIKNLYYEIRLRAHTSAGYGEYYYFKVHA
ncbi:fasciclin-2-like isoform X2 [Uloborus diversus]|uniref:fasciclin-2-like isoform X2 n=1 Tax=Uloborus diversus TaxID=327109 RepID=UPI00240960D4|nr:fasciclin-2-like isoform X2 [Uloborus diversus]